MAVQVVLGGEANAAEYLLTVFGCGQRGLACGGLGQQRGQISVVVPWQCQRRLGAFPSWLILVFKLSADLGDGFAEVVG
jgi:hypothetical protein